MFPRSIAVFALIAEALGAAACTDRGPIHLGKLERSRAGNVEVVEAQLIRRGENGGRLIALYFDPREIAPTLALNERAIDLEVMEPDAFAVINAGFFTPERKPTGLLVSSGRVLSAFVREGGSAGSGVFLIDGGEPALVARDSFTKKSFEDVPFAIQAGPRIIEPGGADGIVSDDGERANRTVIGRDKRGLVAIAVMLGPSGWQSGPTLFETQRLVGKDGLGRAAKELAFELALNLDGGPSTGMHVRAKGKRIDIPESAPVYSVVALRPKQ